MTSKSLKDKIDFLYKIEDKIKSKDKKVQSTKIALSGNFQIISVIDKKGEHSFDKRPLTRLSIFVVLKDSNGRLENAHYGGGGRFLYDNILNDNIIDEYVSKVLHSANELLKSKPAPAGKVNVLLGSGWPGILLQAVGRPGGQILIARGPLFFQIK